MPNYLYNPVSDTFIDTKNLEKVDNSLIPDYLRPLLANSKFDAYYWKDSMKEIKTTGIFKNYTILKKSDNKQYRVKQIDNAFCTNWLVDDFYEARIPMECYALQVIKGTGGAEHSIEYIEYFSQGNKTYLIFEQLNDEWISLEKHISLTGKPGLDESIAKFIFQQVVDCVEALERIGFFHCNITTSNVLINIMTHEIKLTNFENVSEQMYSKTSQRVVSARRDSGVDATGTEKEFCFQESLEVLSLGLLLFELLFGIKPNENQDFSLDLSDVKISRDASLSLKLLLADEPDRIQFHAIQNLRFIAAEKFLVVSRRKRMLEDDAESYITSDSHFLELYPFNVPSDSFGSSESLQKIGILKKIRVFFKRIKDWWF